MAYVACPLMNLDLHFYTIKGFNYPWNLITSPTWICFETFRPQTVCTEHILSRSKVQKCNVNCICIRAWARVRIEYENASHIYAYRYVRTTSHDWKTRLIDEQRGSSSVETQLRWQGYRFRTSNHTRAHQKAQIILYTYLEETLHYYSWVIKLYQAGTRTGVQKNGQTRS